MEMGDILKNLPSNFLVFPPHLTAETKNAMWKIVPKANG